MRDEVGEHLEKWGKRGFELGFGVGISLGYATLGQVESIGELAFKGFHKPVPAFQVLGMNAG